MNDTEKHLGELKRIRKEILRTNRDYEYLFKTVMHYAPFPFWIKDNKGGYLFVNKEWENQFHRHIDEVQNLTDEQVWERDEIASQFRQNDKEVINTQKALLTKETVPDSRTRANIEWVVLKFPIFVSENEREVDRVGGFAIRTDRLKDRIRLHDER